VPLFVKGSLAAIGRTSMSHPHYPLRVCLYPMFHIGSPKFYQAVSRDFERFQVFLLEGVRWRGLRGPLYDLAAKNLGLVTQRIHLKVPPGAERIPLDMSQEEFTRELQHVPLHWRLALQFLRPILWAITSTTAGRHAAWDVFSRSGYLQERQDSDPPYRELILNKRDKEMCQRLRTFAVDPQRRSKDLNAAVVAGPSHMPALYSTLRDCGYIPGTQRWFEVLEGVLVPSRSTDGRAHSTTTGG
jgi:hypothetical protein